jgi:hypothetical protein
MPPKHDYPTFVAACRSGKGVVVLGDPARDARQCFGLSTIKKLLEFIGNNGLEKLSFVNSKVWENSKIPGRIADAYQFYSGETAGYIAFAYCTQTSQWFLKSFHLEDAPKDFRNLPFAELGRLLNDKAKG